MKAEIGVWIDHKKAVIATNAGEHIVTLFSDRERIVRFSNDTGARSLIGAKDYPAEDQHERRIAEHTKRYYSEVISHLRGAGAIIIIGPGEAKFEIEKKLEEEGLKNCVLSVESADKLTDRQIIAKVKKYFASLKLPVQ